MSKPRQPRYGDIFAGHDEGASLAEQARVYWAEYVTELDERGLFTLARGKMLDRLVRLRVEYELHYPVAVSAGPVRVSSGGNEYVNMLWSQCQKMNDQMLKLETALMLTPMAAGSNSERPRGRAPTSAASKYLERSKAN